MARCRPTPSRRSLLAALAMLLVAGCGAFTRVHRTSVDGGLPDLRGAVIHSVADPAINRCVPDVDAALRRLSTDGRPFTLDLAGRPGLGRLTNHAQGIVRLADHQPLFVVSRSGAGVGAMIARASATLFASGDRPAGEVTATIPSPADADHGGGIHALGRILFVPYEDKGERALVGIYDLRDPERPRLIATVDRTVGPIPHAGHAANVSAARLTDGRILLVVGAHSSRSLDFYVSSGTEPAAPDFAMIYFATLHREVPTGFQTTSLLTQCDGTLFLVGAWNTRLPPPSGGRDLLGWYRLVAGRDGTLRLDEAGRAHFDCGRCNFAAGASPYVTATGDITLYAVAHDDLGGALVLEEFAAPARTAAR